MYIFLLHSPTYAMEMIHCNEPNVQFLITRVPFSYYFT